MDRGAVIFSNRAGRLDHHQQPHVVSFLTHIQYCLFFHNPRSSDATDPSVRGWPCNPSREGRPGSSPPNWATSPAAAAPSWCCTPALDGEDENYTVDQQQQWQQAHHIWRLHWTLSSGQDKMKQRGLNLFEVVSSHYSCRDPVKSHLICLESSSYFWAFTVQHPVNSTRFAWSQTYFLSNSDQAVARTNCSEELFPLDLLGVNFVHSNW